MLALNVQSNQQTDSRYDEDDKIFVLFGSGDTSMAFPVLLLVVVVDMAALDICVLSVIGLTYVERRRIT